MNNRKEKGRKSNSRLRFCQTIKANVIWKDVDGNTIPKDKVHEHDNLSIVETPRKTIIHNRYSLSKERI